MPQYPWRAGASTRSYRVTVTRLHAPTPAAAAWSETLTRLVDAINADDAMQVVEREILADGDDCHSLAAEQVG